MDVSDVCFEYATTSDKVSEPFQNQTQSVSNHWGAVYFLLLVQQLPGALSRGWGVEEVHYENDVLYFFKFNLCISHVEVTG